MVVVVSRRETAGTLAPVSKANQRTSVTLSSPITGTVSTNEHHACATPIRFCDNAAPYQTARARLDAGRVHIRCTVNARSAIGTRMAKEGGSVPRWSPGSTRTGPREWRACAGFRMDRRTGLSCSNAIVTKQVSIARSDNETDDPKAPTGLEAR